MRSSPDVAVLAPDPTFGGGGHAQTLAFLAGLDALGRRAELLYAPHPLLRGRRYSVDRIEALRQLRAARTIAPRLSGFRSVWVVSTIATHGAAAPRAKIPYACWLGTTLTSEWRGRRAGMSFAHSIAAAASNPMLRRLELEVVRGASRLYATSASSRSQLAERADVPVETIDVLPIPVDVERLQPVDDETWLAALETPTLVFVGRADDPRKNVRLLLDALPLIRRRVPSARVILIGRPPRGPLPEGAEVAGEVPDIAARLRRAALLVLPSHQEGFGIVAAEALASGVPVVTTPCGGPEHLVRSSGGGVVLGSFDRDDLARAAADLLLDAATLSAMRARGREYVVREHSPARFQTGLSDALRELDELS